MERRGTAGDRARLEAAVSKPKAPRIGRPPVPKKLAKATLLSVRLSEGERKLIEHAAERDGVGLSEWARKALIATAERDRSR